MRQSSAATHVDTFAFGVVPIVSTLTVTEGQVWGAARRWRSTSREARLAGVGEGVGGPEEGRGRGLRAPSDTENRASKTRQARKARARTRAAAIVAGSPDAAPTWLGFLPHGGVQVY